MEKIKLQLMAKVSDQPLLLRELKRVYDSEKFLKERVDWLECLEAAGVDNWQGIEEALAIYDN